MRRRDFLLATGAIGAGLLSVSGAARGGASPDRIQVGVIGTGVRGMQLARFIGADDRFHIKAVCDVLPFRLSDAAEHLGSGVTTYRDYRALLDDSSVDAVIIATTFSSHFHIAYDAIDAGKHVYCEKTMAKGVDAAIRLHKFSGEHPSQIFQTGFQYRYSPLFRTAAQLVADGALGQIAAVNCQWNRNGSWRRPVPDPSLERQVNWRMYREYSSGLAAELSAHQMEFCSYIDPSAVVDIRGTGGIDYWDDGRETYDNINLIVRYESGLKATFASQTTNSIDGFRISILGKSGTVILTSRKGWFVPEEQSASLPDGIDLVTGASVDTGGRSYSTSDARSARQFAAPSTSPTPDALGAFADAILNGSEVECDSLVGARISVMVQMALDAMDKNVVVAWPQIA